MGEEILAHCGIPQNVLEIILGSRSWYAACNGQQEWQRAQLSPGARMLAIVDAFDSMTTDHVYRPARSRERALAELYECAGSQFDPELVRSFDELFLQDQNLFTGKLARRWLQRLPHDGCGLPWKPVSPPEQRQTNPTTPQFEKKLIENMHDGVVFVDGQSTITLWSTGAERLTGVSSHAACGRTFQPALLDMHNPRQRQIPDEACPVAQAIATGVQSIGRVAILGRQGHLVPVDMHVVPVRTNEGAIHGAIVLLHDVSSEASLEERCHSLHVQVTKDPLTQVANRAEFDRMLAFFVTAHQESHLPCSLIMCDIDQFKLINDTWGHQAGDHAIITFSSILKSFCRPGDLVARYGGEEFAILCAHCTNAAATQKADVIRKNLSETRHSCLGNRSITASFGVTELQAGDMPETLLRRADRALLQAKDQGRNQVVQLGDGMMKEKPKKSWWPFPSWSSGAIVETTLRTTVPIEVAIQKLRGFVADQQAKIVKTENNDLLLEVSDGFPANRRAGDRPTTFLIQLNLTQHHHERTNSQGFAAGIYVETRVEVTIRPRRDRDRRREATLDKAQCLLRSLKSYLMASEDHDRPAEMDHLFCEVSLPQ
jgi:diguanylate cyclase (GGDEF)-like protein/PAS domain S-box-containing protein